MRHLPGLPQCVIMPRPGLGRTQGQDAAVGIRQQKVFMGVPFFFTAIVVLLSDRVLGPLGGALGAVQPEVFDLGKARQKGLHLIDLSLGQDHLVAQGLLQGRHWHATRSSVLRRLVYD